MKKFIYLLLLAPVILSACGESFKKTKSGGMQYKIIKDGKGELLKYGSFIEFSFSQRYKDSVMITTADFSNQVAVLDSVSIPVDFYNMFAQCRKGDSIVIKIPTDSVYGNMQKGQAPMPPGIKKGQFLVSGYKIVNVYATRAEADSVFKILSAQAQEKMKVKAKELEVKDDKTINDYLAKNKITAEKTPGGTYVQIVAPGTGNKIDTNVVAKINYTGKTMAGKMFDSNTDPSILQGRPAEPYPVAMWAPQVIPGWVEGLKLLNKGAKAKFFIPSGMGYGQQGSGQDIAPNSILFFDIEVADVVSKDVAMAEAKKQQAEQMKMQQQQMAMQKRYQDSVNRAAKKDSLTRK
jgi:FKBP-type peptidyl-prolyl cis-trans isomerase FkpA